MSALPASYGPFELIERISVGGMAEVFRALHREKRLVVALKRILPTIAEDDEFITLFHDEASIASQLDHENIARIVDVGHVETSHYIALEFVDGQPLRTLIDRTLARGERLPIDVVVHVISEVCRGLGYAHDRGDKSGRPLGIVHRDVSPQNVLISYDGRVKLIDFGIAKAAGKLSRTQAGSIKGKMGYMSPEQVRGSDIDRRSDIFALGICLWEALTLERLFSGPNELFIMEQIRTREIPAPSASNPLLPKDLDRIALKALAKNPKQRYATASDFEADLRAFALSQGVASDVTRVVALMSRLFPSETVHKNGSPQSQEIRMSDKGGSDLDVFDGLAKKGRSSVPAAPSSGSRPAPPPPAPRQKTLLGLAAPVALPPLPGAGARPSGPPAPPVPSRPPGPPSRPSAPPPPALRSVPSAPMPPSPSSGLPPMPGRSVPPPMPGPASRTSGLGPVPSRPPSPPSPNLPPKPAAAAPVDMDWDDEDEKTSVFEKQHEDAARSLLRSAPAPAAGTPPPPSGRVGNAGALLSSPTSSVRPPTPHPPTPMRAPMPPTPSPYGPPMSAPPSMQPALPVPAAYPSVAPQASGSGRTVLVAIAALLVVGLVAALAVLLIPRQGTLVVTVAGPGNKAIDTVQVLVDGMKRCDTSPCRVAGVDAGTHMVKVVAAGYQQTADQAVKVQSGEDAVLNVTLAMASEGTGIKVTAEGAGLRLNVDGKEVGPLPQELKDMSTGEHALRIDGGERYEPWEQKVTVEPEKMLTVEPKLKVIKGLATIKSGANAEGARVLLVSGHERRPIPALPIKIDITTNKPYSLVASKTGFNEFKQDITFEDGQAEKTFVIDMTETGTPPKPVAVGRGPAPGPRPGPLPGPGPDKAPIAEKAPPAGQGTLNINSIPVSNVILDGRPLGTTPKVGLKVPAGAHTVVFVHPEHGRKVRGVTVQAGQTAAAVVRFP